MKETLRTYFSHWSVQMFGIACVSAFVLAIGSGALLTHWYLLPIPFLISPIVEWLVHKHILHAKIDGPPWLKRYMQSLHYDHHADTTNPDVLFAPASSIAIPMVGIFAGLWITRGFAPAIVTAAGALSYYMFYEFTHLSHHIPEYEPMTGYGKKMKKAHLWHHFKSEKQWWGITSHLGDLLFGTFPDANQVEKSDTVRDIARTA